MIKCEALEEFSLKRFDELTNIERANKEKQEKGMIYKKDKFECDKEIADYLTGNNDYKKSFINILEVIPEVKKKETIEDTTIKEEPKQEIKETKKKKRSKK